MRQHDFPRDGPVFRNHEDAPRACSLIDHPPKHFVKPFRSESIQLLTSTSELCKELAGVARLHNVFEVTIDEDRRVIGQYPRLGLAEKALRQER